MEYLTIKYKLLDENTPLKVLNYLPVNHSDFQEVKIPNTLSITSCCDENSNEHCIIGNLGVLDSYKKELIAEYIFKDVLKIDVGKFTKDLGYLAICDNAFGDKGGDCEWTPVYVFLGWVVHAPAGQLMSFQQVCTIE